MFHGDWLRQSFLCGLHWVLVFNLFSPPCIRYSSTVSEGYVVRQIHPELHKSYSSQPGRGLISELAHISFVTELRHKRDLSQNEYHIIKLHRVESNETIEIHLVKREPITSHDFKVVVRNGDEVEDDGESLSSSRRTRNATENNCLYEGTITSELDGKAALSSCGKQPGFSGIIVTNTGNWIIEPQTDVGKDQHSEDDKLYMMPTVIPHIISRVDFASSTDRSHQALGSDELHVPADELEKAAELAKAEAAANNELNGDINEEDNNSTDTGSDDNVSSDDDNNEEVILLMPNSEGGSAVNIELMATRSPISRPKKRRGNKRATQTSARRSSSTLRTAKASTTASAKSVVVEIAVFTDDDFYEQMIIRYPKDTKDRIKDYVLTMVHSMDLLYQQESLGTDVHFKLVHLDIQKKRPRKLNSHGGKAKSYLTSFCDYAGDLNTNNNRWDHALMLTGHDLIEEGTSSTAGLAWAGTMCYRYYSCSISEGTQFGSVFIITHEIGHSMGMEHDGMGVSSKCDEDKYLMSPTTGPGKVTWSTCSGQNLKDFLKYGTSELRGRKSSVLPVCMTTSSRDSKNIQYTSSTLPGQKYDANKQCVLSMGKKYTPVMRKDNPFNNICSMLYCGNGTHAISTHPALDGTECGTGKECKGGQCTTPSKS